MAEDPFKKALKAWHASPYDFEEFGPIRDVSGKGQGAAMYGRGLYVAENPKVSGPGESEYMKEFSYHPYTRPENLGGLSLESYLGDSYEAAENRRGLVSYPGLKEEKKLNTRQQDLLHRLIGEYVQSGKYLGYGKDLLGFMKDKGASTSYINHIKIFYSFGEGKGPFSYEVNVHLTPETMLDWDETFNNHHPIAKNGITKAFSSVQKLPMDADGEPGDAAHEMLRRNKNVTGSTIYNLLTTYHGSDYAASEALYNAGIHGIRYKDGGSRNISPIMRFDGLSILQHLQSTTKSDDQKNAVALSQFVERTTSGSLQDAIEAVKRNAEYNRKRGETYYADRDDKLAKWVEDNSHRISIAVPKPTYNYVIFHPDFVEAVAQYDIKGNKVKDLSPGVHLKAVDHNPFEGEK